MRHIAPVVLIVLAVLTLLPLGTEAQQTDAHRTTELLLEPINAARAEEGLPRLAADPRLATVAASRAREMARADSVQSDQRSMAAVSRGLLAEGYDAFVWAERAILGDGAPGELVARWARGRDRVFRQTALGKYEDFGAGWAETADGRTVVTLLFATPEITWELEVATPLEDPVAVRRQVLDATNRARRRRGLRAVESDPRLDRAAARHAEDMLARGYYDHRAPDGSVPAERVAAEGYGHTLVSENIARGIFSPDEVVERWLESPGHRRNILRREVRDHGIGFAVGERDGHLTVLWVQILARPR